MSIRDEVEREAEQYATRFQPAHGDDRPFMLKGAETFRAGVVRGYVDALTKREPTDAEVEAGKAVLETAGLTVFDDHLPGLSEHLARKVLFAARNVRRDEGRA